MFQQVLKEGSLEGFQEVDLCIFFLLNSIELYWCSIICWVETDILLIITFLGSTVQTETASWGTFFKCSLGLKDELIMIWSKVKWPQKTCFWPLGCNISGTSSGKHFNFGSNICLDSMKNDYIFVVKCQRAWQGHNSRIHTLINCNCTVWQRQRIQLWGGKSNLGPLTMHHLHSPSLSVHSYRRHTSLKMGS